MITNNAQEADNNLSINRFQDIQDAENPPQANLAIKKPDPGKKIKIDLSLKPTTKFAESHNLPIESTTPSMQDNQLSAQNNASSNNSDLFANAPIAEKEFSNTQDLAQQMLQNNSGILFEKTDPVHIDFEIYRAYISNFKLVLNQYYQKTTNIY